MICNAVVITWLQNLCNCNSGFDTSANAFLRSTMQCVQSIRKRTVVHTLKVVAAIDMIHRLESSGYEWKRDCSFSLFSPSFDWPQSNKFRYIVPSRSKSCRRRDCSKKGA